MTSDHMTGLIRATIHRLNIPSHVRDEAESEAWVIVAEALDSFDASHGVPLAAYVALRLRWGLADWQAKSIRNSGVEYRGSVELGDGFVDVVDPESLRDIDHEAECAVMLAIVLELCDTILTTKERICLLGTAIEMKRADISRLTKLNGKGIVEQVASARTKLKIALKIDDEGTRLPSSNKVY